MSEPDSGLCSIFIIELYCLRRQSISFSFVLMVLLYIYVLFLFIFSLFTCESLLYIIYAVGSMLVHIFMTQSVSLLLCQEGFCTYL